MTPERAEQLEAGPFRRNSATSWPDFCLLQEIQRVSPCFSPQEMRRKGRNMLLEAIDMETLSIRVRISDLPAASVPGRLSSLAMVASDCGVGSIVCEYERPESGPEREAIDCFIRSNPVFEVTSVRERPPEDDEFGFVVIGRNDGMLCLRDSRNPAIYSIFLAPDIESAGKVSIISYFIANVLGFSSFLSFEVRFSVYELLLNIVEHGKMDTGSHYIKMVLEKNDGKLIVSITDKGVEFDPTGKREFNLARFLGSGIFRGLGLSMMRKVVGKLDYQREEGYNKIFFEKAVSAAGKDAGGSCEPTPPGPSVTECEDSSPRSRRIKLAGHLDSRSVPMIGERMNDMLAGPGPVDVELDFSDVKFISSIGVGLLLGLVTSVRSRGGEAVFKGVTPKVMSVFKLLGLKEHFRIEADKAGVSL